jgi:hypothetical protein
MNVHFLGFMFLAYFSTKALEFIASMLFSASGRMANPTASRMLGYGT